MNVSHPVMRCAGLLLVLIGTPLVRFASCFSIGAALTISGLVELVRAWVMLPEIPSRDLRDAAPRCSP